MPVGTLFRLHDGVRLEAASACWVRGYRRFDADDIRRAEFQYRPAESDSEPPPGATGLKAGESWQSLGLDGSETFSISGVEDMKPRKVLQVKAVKPDGRQIDFEVIARLDTEVDVAYFENNGILPYVLRKVVEEA